VKAAVDSGVEQLGRLDIIVANAGIGNGGDTLDQTSELDWDEMIDINLSGVWKSVKAVVSHLISGGRGGSIILTSSVGGLKAYPHCGNYVAAKNGVVALMRGFAVELGQHNIRVNTVHPTHVATPMLHNEGTFKMFGRIWRTRAPTTWRRSATCSIPCPSPGSRPSTSATRCSSSPPTRRATSPV
jgi:(+)-trans-carveol dehydrogenase